MASSGTTELNAEYASAQPARRAETVPAKLWAARGFFGGLVAFALAGLAQLNLLSAEYPDLDISLRYYVLAAVVLVVSLSSFAVGSRSQKTEVRSQKSEGTAEADDAKPATLRSSLVLGLKSFARDPVALAGSGLTIVLLAASIFVLMGNVAAPVGGWLWAGALVAMLATSLWVSGVRLKVTGFGRKVRTAEDSLQPFAGSRASSETLHLKPREGLLPGPESDRFAPGVPRFHPLFEALLVAGMLGLALFFRVYYLEAHPGIFGDEGEQGLDARNIMEGGTPNIFGTGWWGVPNLAFYMWSYSLRIFGDNVFGLRMFGVVAGLVAVWYVYRTGRLLWGPRAGLIAGFLMAVWPLALQFSRFANVSAETLALWAVGFYYFFMALRHRRWSDWVLAGFAWGLNLYFYPAGKLIIPLIGAVGVYCFVRWSKEFIKTYAAGFILLGIAFLGMFMPYGIFCAQQNWVPFTGRANETSIFTPENQALAFAEMEVPYDPEWAKQPVLQNIMAHPAHWGVLLFNELRVSTEFLYARRDNSHFYEINDHRGSAFSPLVAVLVVLGLIYAAWKFWDPRFGLVSIWFWVGLVGMILTLGTPTGLRSVDAAPALVLIPAALLDRVMAAAWPLGLNLARRWLLVPLAVLLVLYAQDGFDEYFHHYASLHPFMGSTIQARYAQTLKQAYKAYQLGLGDSFVPFGYGSTRFVAKGVEGVDVAAPVDTLPLLDNNSKGAAFILYNFNSNPDYLPLIRLFYPQGAHQHLVAEDGIEYFQSYKVTARQVVISQRAKVTYLPSDGRVLTRTEPNLGTAPAQGEWAPPPTLAYPAQATWEGGLVAPAYGTYTLEVAGGPSKLEIDGKVVVDEGEASTPRTAGVVLAKGIHDIKLTTTLRSQDDRPQVRWALGGTMPVPIAPQFLFNGPTGGLSAEVVKVDGGELVDSLEPFAGLPVSQRRSDPAVGFVESTSVFGGQPFTVRWRGTLQVSASGTYTFEVSAGSSAALFIDGQKVARNYTLDGELVGATGRTRLEAGEHSVDLRYAWRSGQGRIEWYWTPPGGVRELVPTTALRPEARSWLASEMPDVPPPQVSLFPGGGTTRLVPVTVIDAASEVSKPRGIAVDSRGNIYVGDLGSQRVVVYSPDGRYLRAWGKAAGPDKVETPQAGVFAGIQDIAIGSDDSVYVLDGAAGVHVFSPEGVARQVFSVRTFGMHTPDSLALDAAGNIYIADPGLSRVLRVSTDGASAFAYAGRTDTGRSWDKLEQPIDAAPLPGDRQEVYAVDLRDRVVQLSPEGEITKAYAIQIGREGQGSRIAAGPDGRIIYMTDPERARIAALRTEDGFITYFGGRGRTPGLFTGPLGITVDAQGRVYVLDRDSRIQVFDGVTGDR